MRWHALAAALLMLLLVPASVAAQDFEGGDDGEVLVRVNGSDRVEEDETLEVVVIVSGDLAIAGAVTGTTVVVDGDVAVLGDAFVDGTLVVVDGTLTLRDGSVTDADIYLSDGATWIQEEGAVVTGEVRHGDFGLELDSSDAWQLALISFVFWLGSTLVAVLVALVFAGVGGRQLWDSAANLTGRAGATLLATLAFWLGLLLLMVPLGLSGIGALLVPVLIITGMAVWYLGYVAFGTRIGALITRRRMGDPTMNHPYLPAIAGALLLQLVLLVAMAALLSGVIAIAIGDGAEGLGALFGVPAAILYVALWLAGILGGGALVLKSVSAWSSDD